MKLTYTYLMVASLLGTLPFLFFPPLFIGEGKEAETMNVYCGKVLSTGEKMVTVNGTPLESPRKCHHCSGSGDNWVLLPDGSVDRDCCTYCWGTGCVEGGSGESRRFDWSRTGNPGGARTLALAILAKEFNFNFAMDGWNHFVETIYSLPPKGFALTSLELLNWEQDYQRHCLEYDQWLNAIASPVTNPVAEGGRL